LAQKKWQNGVAGRWVGNYRRNVLNHVIVLNWRHLKRLLYEYVRYYHDDRTHHAQAKRTPAGGEVEKHTYPGCKLVSISRPVGLHHRYALAA
jgi:hypothetical protein